MREDALQAKVMLWWDAHCEEFGAKPSELAHIPNGLISARMKNKVIPLGVRKGYPDLMMPIPRGIYHGLFIELKAPDVDVERGLSREQKAVLKRLSDRGYLAVAVNDFDTVVRIISNYLRGVLCQ